MKKILFIAAFILIPGLVFPISSLAQETTGNATDANNLNLQNNEEHTAREEAEGKAVWEKLQAKQTTCSDLSEENFGALGEYFMGQMMGAFHEAMNNMMIQMMGKEGEEQMHTVMGKRLSGCNTSAVFPAQGAGFMPMMNMFVPYGTAGSRKGMMGGGSASALPW